VSYPTVRAKLDEVITRLTASETAEPPAAVPDRRAILDAVARGEITPAEAAAQIRATGGN
jgi:hypothetical protein